MYFSYKSEFISHNYYFCSELQEKKSQLWDITCKKNLNYEIKSQLLVYIFISWCKQAAIGNTDDRKQMHFYKQCELCMNYTNIQNTERHKIATFGVCKRKNSLNMDWRRKQIKCIKSTDVKYNKINTYMCLMNVFFPLVWKIHVMEANVKLN